MAALTRPLRVDGTVRVPGDKSISHRALLLAALATGRSRIRGLLDSHDVRSTAAVLRSYGVAVPPVGDEMIVEGHGASSFQQPSTQLDCGNSGTTVRLTSGIAAALPLTSEFVGDASLSRRPMGRVARPLRAMGAVVEFPGSEGPNGASARETLPMRVMGRALRSVEWETEVASAQVKSAILLAGVSAGVPVLVREPVRTRDHTERMLGEMGATVEAIDSTVVVRPPTGGRLAPLDLAVPGDPSSAAFFVTLALLADAGTLELPDVCLNVTRTGFLRAVRQMGARVETAVGEPQGGEPVGTLRVSPPSSPLRAISVGARDVPAMIDEIPLLACLAARADGTTEISGAQELRVKESDRIATVVANLRAIGVDAEERPDGMLVHGTQAPLAGEVRTAGDHRIAMAFGVLGAATGRAVTVDDPACADVSFPGFWDTLRRLTHAAGR
ncbi:MAG TPA: 3-phosphoshikimate 1-carboxyvinyltransferase [Gemmatimonadaceae bacterium]|nr:3-phosphoshikimate 1-carboxyvinyltransferase [Gemmatimonadaceae bacterium]